MLRKVVFKDYKYLYVDLEYLKDSYLNGRLLGANVFARIFGIVEDNLFKNEINDSLNLSFYDIYIEHWVLLFSFIRNGYVSSLYNDAKQMNDCYGTSIKLGGIPEFEKYYNYYFDYNENMKNITYNPMTPQEDVSNIYSWRVISMFSLLENGESVTVCISQDPTLAMYARKKNAV
tara:strand:- start:3762 stop:4286 length:525 start_codon:yes stop_codon:yes gene_type:complete